MVPLTKLQLQVLARLNASPDGQLLKQILEARLAEKDRDCRRLDGPDLHRAQGSATELAWLLESLAGAREKVEAQQAPQGSPVRRVTWNPTA